MFVVNCTPVPAQLYVECTTNKFYETVFTSLKHHHCPNSIDHRFGMAWYLKVVKIKILF